MEFRDHPILICDGIKAWPPKWLYACGPSMLRWVSGEVGVLDAVFLSHASINKVCLLISEEGNSYLGVIMFERPDSAKTVFEFLNSYIGKSIAAIAATEF